MAPFELPLLPSTISLPFTETWVRCPAGSETLFARPQTPYRGFRGVSTSSAQSASKAILLMCSIEQRIYILVIAGSAIAVPLIVCVVGFTPAGVAAGVLFRFR